MILLDLILPSLDGFEVLRQLKNTDATSKIPVIVLSNLGQQSDIEKTKQLGAVKHLIKADLDLDNIANEIASVIVTKK